MLNESIAGVTADEEITNMDFNQSPRLNINSSEIDLSGLITSPKNLPKLKKLSHQTRKSLQEPLKPTALPLISKPQMLPRLKLDVGQLNITHSRKSLMDSLV